MYLVIQLGDTLISSFSVTWVSKISEGIADADVKRETLFVVGLTQRSGSSGQTAGV
jgi:hypothetical protein